MSEPRMVAPVLVPPPMAPDPSGSWLDPVRYVIAALGGAVLTFVGFRTRFAEHEARMKAQDAKFEAHEQKLIDHENDVTAKQLRLGTEFAAEIAELRAEMDNRHRENKSRQRMMDRRSLFTLKLVADVARKIGVDNRTDDAVIGFLTKGDGDDEDDVR
jgi:hypothetical protein